jgi:hypothetical protein
MSWINEAVHVARKDARQARVALAVYSIIVLVAFYSALMLPARAEDTTMLTASVLTVMVFGVILGASAVQADSPTQSNAFWASRPFRPTAMLGAKLLYCGAVIAGIPLVAELIGLIQFQATTATIVDDLLRSSAIFGLLLLSTVVIASLTSDLRGFIVATLVLCVGFVLVTLVVATRIGRLMPLFGPSGPWLIALLAVPGSIALAAWLYRRRDVSRVAWVGAVIVVAASIGLLAEVGTPGPKSVEAASTVVDPTVTLEHVGLSGGQTGSFGALDLKFFVADPGPMRRVSLTIHDATLRLRDGSTVRAQRRWDAMTTQNSASLLPAGVRQFGSSTTDGSLLSTQLPFSESDAIRVKAVGIASVEVKAVANVVEARPLAAGRFGETTRATHDGTRVEIGGDQSASRSYMLEVLTASLIRDPIATAFPISVTVVYDRQHEGLVLDAQQYGNSSSWMVLPGATVWTSRVSFNTLRPGDSNARIMTVATEAGRKLVESVAARDRRFPDPSWYPGAKITVFRWAPAGSRSVRLSRPAD